MDIYEKSEGQEKEIEELQDELTAAKAEVEQQKALIAELVEALDFTRINEQVIKGALKKHRAWKEKSNG